ncbi:Csu type fimbrial protein [Acinetobacter wuhouensis]|uniref:SCPU domain-containing protein n=1 Tax=Acinetobacter wuhouensis TaxID=1879050 RepID=A0A3G2SZY6_9GAMM|nr:spore coat U domain-containing protein [Acinetobacter wuhouensis]AYO53236.1 SCPU domain-containing protein [Acinetobacter wuhouensis]
MKLPIFLFLTLAGIGASAYIYAGNQNSVQFRVQVHIKESCNISSQGASNLDFGTVNRSADSLSAQGNLNITCTQGTPYTIALKSDRKMLNQATSGAVIPYTLYQDANQSIVWGFDSNQSYTNTGIGANQNIPVWGKVAKQDTNVPSGSYSDTVTAVVSY